MEFREWRIENSEWVVVETQAGGTTLDEELLLSQPIIDSDEYSFVYPLRICG